MSEFLVKTKTESEFLKGISYNFHFLSSSDTNFSDLKEIKNLLKFLRIKKSLQDSLIEKTCSKKNFKDLIQFFQTYKLTF